MNSENRLSHTHWVILQVAQVGDGYSYRNEPICFSSCVTTAYVEDILLQRNTVDRDCSGVQALHEHVGADVQSAGTAAGQADVALGAQLIGLGLGLGLGLG